MPGNRKNKHKTNPITKFPLAFFLGFPSYPQLEFGHIIFSTFLILVKTQIQPSIRIDALLTGE